LKTQQQRCSHVTTLRLLEVKRRVGTLMQDTADMHDVVSNPIVVNVAVHRKRKKIGASIGPGMADSRVITE
jgi:hypothetical protein